MGRQDTNASSVIRTVASAALQRSVREVFTVGRYRLEHRWSSLCPGSQTPTAPKAHTRPANDPARRADATVVLDWVVTHRPDFVELDRYRAALIRRSGERDHLDVQRPTLDRLRDHIATSADILFLEVGDVARIGPDVRIIASPQA